MREGDMRIKFNSRWGCGWGKFLMNCVFRGWVEESIFCLLMSECLLNGLNLM